MLNEIYPSYLDSLLKGNHQQCGEIVRGLLNEDISLYELYVHLFQRSLYDVGELWERNKITVATEHMATAITERMMIEAYPKLFSQKYTGKSAIVACPVDEYHQIGAQMVADVFELNGWHGYFLGANTPINDLHRFIAEKKPDMLALSISMSFNFGRLAVEIEKLREKFPVLPILLGGQAFRWGGQDLMKRYDGLEYLPDLYSLELRIKRA